MYQKPKGTRDILPLDVNIWQKMEKAARETAEEYNIKEIRTPIFEDVSLFLRSVGESSDIVNKEMYVFSDKGGRKLALRPEGTAGVVRACIENGLFNNSLPLKVWYLGNNFRYENPQAGRYREFTQFGVEYFGSGEPYADVECILIMSDVLKKLGVNNYELQINSIGCPNCRADYNKAIREFGKIESLDLCEDCRRRAQVNPLRMLDCKNEKCQNILKKAPKLSEYLCPECKEHFEKVLKMLDEFGIKYVVNPNLVRGLDYYSKTVFEFVVNIDNKPLTVGGGGRYDYLVEEIGGNPLPACGFAIGLDRLKLLIKNNDTNKDLIYIANAGSVEISEVMKLARLLRNAGINVETNISNRSFKAQMKYLDKIHARMLVVLGDDELKNEVFTVKNLNNGKDCTVPANSLIKYLKLSDDELKKIIEYADF